MPTGDLQVLTSLLLSQEKVGGGQTALPTFSRKESTMDKSDVRRISAEEAHRRLDSGKAILVCGYEADKKFRDAQLAGAESLNHFRNRLPELSKDQEIIFYCG